MNMLAAKFDFYSEDMENKRRHSRSESMSVSTTFVCVDDKNRVTNRGNAKTLNVSESGMLLESDIAIEAGQTILMSITFEQDMADIKAKVIRCVEKQGKFEIGVQFIDINWYYSSM